MTDTPKNNPPTTGAPTTRTTTTGMPTGTTTTTSTSGTISPGPESPSTDRLKQKARDASREASRAASDSARDLRGRAETGLHDARERVVGQGEGVKNSLADQVSETARALDKAAQEVDENSVQHQCFKSASDGLTQLSDSLHGKSVGDMVADLAEFGRRNPAAFLGGAALAGFALARFARASERRTYGQSTYGQSSPYRPTAAAGTYERPTATPYQTTPYSAASPAAPGYTAGGSATVTSSSDKETL